ncbi:LysM peptidoglycan-binding domain-containing protein [Bremerella cremea]|uniref:LysM peptidoglycan-binding domain-containing protein n=1 Tax=Bremerella cremea TaxID=1031537 RepID=UPI0031EAA681
METIKTACMVIVLMAIGYGVYTVLNKPEEVPPEVADAADNMDLTLPDFSTLPMPTGAPAASPGTSVAMPAPASDDNAPGFASGRLTAPQLNNTGGGAPSFTPTLSPQRETAQHDDHDHASHGSSDAAPKFAGASDFPPMDNPTATKPAGTMPTPESHIPATPDASRNQLASVYSHGDMGAMPSGMGGNPNSPPSGQFQADWDEAQLYLTQGDLVEAMRRLTPWRNSLELNPSQKEKLNLLLSQLAGTVVYSTQHTLEEPYTVGSSETLESIAQQFQIPSILLQRINGIDNPNALTPGKKIKVMRGPFAAKVDLTHNELILEVDGCYAGRFPITIENGAIIPAGEHEVLRKETNPQFYDDSTQRILTSDDPENPYGGFAVHLDGGVVLHGSGGAGGSISMSQRDAEDIYGILSVGSKVTVRR